jgi:hypothetical protein
MQKRNRARTGPTPTTEEVRRARAVARIAETLSEEDLIERWTQMKPEDADAVIYLIPEGGLEARDDVYWDGKRHRIIRPVEKVRKGRKTKLPQEPIVLIQLKPPPKK